MSETTTGPSEWDLIWTQQADDELVRKVIARSAAEIDSFLISDDETEEETLELIGRRVGGPIDNTTYDLVLDALRALIGQDGANAVHWYVIANGASTGILEEVAPPRVAFFLRRIAAAHLPELRAAFSLWKEVPDDWKTIHRDVYYDFINQRFIVRHRIVKLNGEEMVVEGHANSVLDFTRSLLTSVGMIGSRDAFGEREVELFLNEADSVLAMLRPQEQASQDGDGDLAVGDISRPAET